MISSTEELGIFKLDYYSGDIPPPYCYSYHLLIDQKSENNTEFEIFYHDREELTDEEILEEGFSLTEKYAWKGNLPQAWLNEIINTLNKTSWLQENSKRNAEESGIHITVIDEKLKPHEGEPSDKKIWEYLMQEIIQAIYEIDKLESPLYIRFQEVIKGRSEERIELDISFAKRQFFVTKIFRDTSERISEQPWGFLKEILKIVYSLDFVNPNTNKKLKSDKYLDPGDGMWYPFTGGIKNQNEKNDALNSLEKTLKEL